ncbi:hypothetical protein ACTQ49_04755 [Luteococcus sp. Sow4_B9]|uniref:hypothetical protein n=1 Tax=Luteococcus sp. Sow4_B9 TaxID=3438792 RepID=UPI003F99D9BF
MGGSRGRRRWHGLRDRQTPTLTEITHENLLVDGDKARFEDHWTKALDRIEPAV